MPTADVPGESDEDVVTYSLSPEWHLSDDAMLYARIATGYRPGGPNVFLPGVPPTVDSDSMTELRDRREVRLADGSVQLEVAVFYMDWEDIQLGSRSRTARRALPMPVLRKARASRGR